MREMNFTSASICQFEHLNVMTSIAFITQTHIHILHFNAYEKFRLIKTVTIKSF